MQLNFPVTDTLFEKARLSFMSCLWNSALTMDHLERIILDIGCKDTRVISTIEEQAYNTIAKKVPLPQGIKLCLIKLIQPMGRQILQFLDKTSPVLSLWLKTSNLNIRFIWLDKGVLNWEKTAEFIINKNSCYPEFVFHFACVICCENILLQFTTLCLAKFQTCEGLLNPCSFVTFWFESLSKLHNNNITISHIFSDLSIQRILSFSDEMNYLSVKFLVEKFHEPKKTAVIKSMLNYFPFLIQRESIIIHYLLSNLPDSFVLNYVKKHADYVLSCFLDWPCVDLFIPAVNQLWNDLSKPSYLFLTLEIAEYVQNYSMTDEYESLFFKFWDLTPASFKEYIHSKCVSGTFLSRLLSLNNTDNIFKHILKDLTLQVRQQIIFYFEGMNLCDYLLQKGKIKTLKIFLMNCIPNSKVLEEFLLEYEAYEPSYQNEERVLRKKEFRIVVTSWFSS